MTRRTIPELDQAGIENGELAAMVRLRFDRVVIRLIEDVRAAVETSIPDTHWVLFTTTAPILKPSKVEAFLVAAIEGLLRDERAPAEREAVFEGNTLHIRLLPDRPRKALRLMGFVHNPSPRATDFLAAVQMACRRADMAD